MKLIIFLLIVWFGIASAAEPQRNLGIAAASGEKRVALVIGNSAYKDAPLKNPVNDAKDMAATLRRLGFDVIEKTNVSQKEINRAIAQFGEKLRADTVALFFFAGHGMQVKGKNYIIPIDAHITGEATVRAETVDVDTVMDQLVVSPMNIVILDACRNNPFERKFRSTSGGLAQMDAPKGSLIAYATAPGKTAADGNSRNGLYTQELLKHIQTPSLPLEAVFKRVRNGVMAASGEAQTPWEASSLTGDFYFRPTVGAASATAQQGTPPVDLTAVEVSFWESIKNSNDAEDFQAYLDKYPGGQFASLAERRIKKKPVKQDHTGNGLSTEANVLTIPGAVRNLEWADSDNGFDINWNEATKYCSSKGSEWRLPTAAELENSFQLGHSAPCASVWLTRYTCKVSSNSRLTGIVYWSNERNGPSEAWFVSLAVGNRGTNSVEIRDLRRALCVRQL